MCRAPHSPSSLMKLIADKYLIVKISLFDIPINKHAYRISNTSYNTYFISLTSSGNVTIS
jgi:hypothetical protein